MKREWKEIRKFEEILFDEAMRFPMQNYSDYSRLLKISRKIRFVFTLVWKLVLSSMKKEPIIIL